MDMFTLLVIIALMMVSVGIFMVVKLKYSKKNEIIVSYSEKIGDRIIEHSQHYMGYISEKDDILDIPALKLKRPVPMRELMIPTNTGKKKIYIIKIDNSRYAYRLPTLHNTIITYQRDINGNILKKNGKPLLKKLNWQYSDNVIEPDVIHWEEYIRDELYKKHMIRKSMLEKWLVPISMVLIFLFAVVAINISTKQMMLDKQAIMEKALEAENQAKQTSDNLNTLLEKITGQRVLSNDENRVLYHNSTG